jgi:hypothetical protein
MSLEATEKLTKENLALKNELARLNGQTHFICQCGGTKLTPRTDAEASNEVGKSSIAQGWYVHADFARTLERENSLLEKTICELREALLWLKQQRGIKSNRLDEALTLARTELGKGQK